MRRLPRFESVRLHQGSWLRWNLWREDMFIWDEANRDEYRFRSLGWAPDVFIDIGAHIGLFSRLARQLWPLAKIIAVEPVAENVAVLRRNCPSAEIHEAACTYQPEPIRVRVLLNGEHSGGSHVSAQGNRVVRRVTLDELMGNASGNNVLLKLDAEGAEFSLLESAQCFDRIRTIVGESHGHARFVAAVRRRLPHWKLTVFRDTEIGLFRLERP